MWCLQLWCASVASPSRVCAALYLQLAVVQAGHRNLLHFHLPELPDEQTLLWSCCSAAGIGQNQGCGERGERQKAPLNQCTRVGARSTRDARKAMQILTTSRRPQRRGLWPASDAKRNKLGAALRLSRRAQASASSPHTPGSRSQRPRLSEAG